MRKRIELLSPAGSLAHLKAAISRGADAVYLGMQRFSARDYATNFRKEELRQAVNLCKSSNVRLYLAMNTLVKNEELKPFFGQLSFAYACGIDAVIIQEIALIDLIKKNYPGLRVHISTQAGVMNSAQARLLGQADRITMARELRKEEVRKIKAAFPKGIEIFCHGALCVSVSGQCLFSSLLGGRSGNRGKCAQPCRKRYNGEYYLSTKELCLIGRLPEIIRMGVDAIKIEGRMRTPYYAATVTEIYRRAIDSFYAGEFEVTDDMQAGLEQAFSREFTEGGFAGEDIFNRAKATGVSRRSKLEDSRCFGLPSSRNLQGLHLQVRHHNSGDALNAFSPRFHEGKLGTRRKIVQVKLPRIEKRDSRKLLLVRVYNGQDAMLAAENGADIIYLDLFCGNFREVKAEMGCKLFAATQNLMFDSDIAGIKDAIRKNKPDGILAGNTGILGLGLNLPIHLNYNLNFFNEIAVSHFPGCLPIISPELSIRELKRFENKNFAVMVHGKLRLMTLRHELQEGTISDEKGGVFKVQKIINGSEILNEKELGLSGKSSILLKVGINTFFVDTDTRVGEVVALYRAILDGKKPDDSRLRPDYVLGWSFRGIQ